MLVQRRLRTIHLLWQRTCEAFGCFAPPQTSASILADGLQFILTFRRGTTSSSLSARMLGIELGWTNFFQPNPT